MLRSPPCRHWHTCHHRKLFSGSENSFVTLKPFVFLCSFAQRNKGLFSGGWGPGFSNCWWHTGPQCVRPHDWVKPRGKAKNLMFLNPINMVQSCETPQIDHGESEDTQKETKRPNVIRGILCGNCQREVVFWRLGDSLTPLHAFFVVASSTQGLFGVRREEVCVPGWNGQLESSGQLENSENSLRWKGWTRGSPATSSALVGSLQVGHISPGWPQHRAFWERKRIHLPAMFCASFFSTKKFFRQKSVWRVKGTFQFFFQNKP